MVTVMLPALVQDDHDQGLDARGVTTNSKHNAAMQAAQHGAHQHTGARHAGSAAVVHEDKVREKAARAAMPAWDCPTCAGFFAALQNQGYGQIDEVVRCPDCKQADTSGMASGAAAAAQDGSGATGANAQIDAAAAAARNVAGLRQNAGRHRCNFAAPSTPTGYWAMGFAGRDRA